MSLAFVGLELRQCWWEVSARASCVLPKHAWEQWSDVKLCFAWRPPDCYVCMADCLNISMVLGTLTLLMSCRALARESEEGWKRDHCRPLGTGP